MDIYLSINNREEVIKLPVLPKQIKLNSPQKHKGFETVNLGDLMLIGLSGLKSMEISSFFPSKDYPFLRDKSHKGWEYVEMIEKWIGRRLPLRLLITETPINMPCVIENFSYSIKDGSQDIQYSLKLKEYKLVNIDRKKV